MNFNYLISHEQPNATPPVVGIFIMDLMLDWIVRQGGVSEIEKRNNMKAGMIYDVIDQYEDVYFNSIEKVSRSRMNITWNMKDESVVQRFVQFSEANGFTGIRGHRSLGGIRVSLYNTVSVEQTRRFADLMIEFARK